VVHLAEVGSLVWLDLRKSKIFPFKLDQWIPGLVLMVFWYFWFPGTSSFLVLLVLVKTRVSLYRIDTH
jgi:hypothetical protein